MNEQCSESVFFFKMRMQTWIMNVDLDPTWDESLNPKLTLNSRIRSQVHILDLKKCNNSILYKSYFSYLTVCTGSSDSFYIVSYYIKWGHYFLCPKLLNEIKSNLKYGQNVTKNWNRVKIWGQIFDRISNKS